MCRLQACFHSDRSCWSQHLRSWKIPKAFQYYRKEDWQIR